MTISVTAGQLSAAAPNGDPAIIKAIADESAAVFAKYGLTTRNRVLGFLSTALEESGFRMLTENLNYSAARAAEVWPSKFPTAAAASPYAGNPRALANKVYGARMGNVGPDDGWRYRGQGLIQITGRNNFAALEKATGLPLLDSPELATDPAHLLECSVALFVQYPGILGYCDAGDWNAVWALVGTGSAKGRLINPQAHRAALAALDKALPARLDGLSAPAAPSALSSAPVSAAPAPKGWFARLIEDFARLLTARA